MVCPEFKEGQCGLHDSSYTLTSQHIASYCEFPGDEYRACSEFIQLSRAAKPSSLEDSASSQSLPKLTDNPDPARISIETRPNDHEFD